MKVIKYVNAQCDVEGFCNPFGKCIAVNFGHGLLRAVLVTFHESYHYIFAYIKFAIPNPYIEDERILRIYSLFDFLSDFIHYVPIIG